MAPPSSMKRRASRSTVRCFRKGRARTGPVRIRDDVAHVSWPHVAGAARRHARAGLAAEPWQALKAHKPRRIQAAGKASVRFE